MKYMLLAAISIVLIFVGTVMFKLGVHKDVRIAELDEGPTRQVYKLHIGAYHKTVATIVEVETWARENGEKCELSFGEYLDDPKKVDEDRLQSHAGCIVTAEFTAKLPDGFKYRELPKQHYVVATFDGSPSIAPYKVYPRVFDYFRKTIGQEFSSSVTEVYKILSPEAVESKYYFPVKDSK